MQQDGRKFKIFFIFHFLYTLEKEAGGDAKRKVFFLGVMPHSHINMFNYLN